MDHRRIVVAQLGARRSYLVPSALQQDGVLEHFFTDIYMPHASRVRSLARWGQKMPVHALRRLASRTAALPPQKVTAFWTFGMQYRLRAWQARRSGPATPAWLWGGQRFCELIVRRGLGRANAVYAYSSAALELFEWAKARGMACILDHATAPKLQEDSLVQEQCERYPGWSKYPPAQDPWAEPYSARQRRESELADVVLCGSTFVKRMVRRDIPELGRAEVVPLALRAAPAERRRRDEATRPLRVLFVGDEVIRKGVGDLCRALDALPRGSYEARLAGKTDLSGRGRKQASDTLCLLGRVPRHDMPALYHWADVLVLPSVSDTFGLVLLEAMSFGLPVIATVNTAAPDFIRHGEDGFIVPIMQPDAIAESLEMLSADRERLEQMSQNAYQRAREFSLERYAERLQAILATL